MSTDLRGASAEAAAGLATDLESALGGVSGDEAASTAAALFSVAGTLRSEGALRRFLTDASIPADAKSGLIDQVFAAAVPEAVVGLLRNAASRRWTASRDLADVLEDLSVVAHVSSAGDAAPRLIDELFTIGQTVKASPELRDALSDPVRSEADKAGLLDTLLGDQVLPATGALARQALSGSFHTVAVALTAYERTAAATVGQRVATVRAARPLADADAERLTSVLSRQYGRPVHLNVVVEQGVLGGLRVEIGDDVIDGTVASRLDEARRAIATG